jgi:hypothetical protein
MADLGIVGAPDHVGEVYSAAVAMRELRLSSDPAAPVELRQAAAVLEAAVLDLRDAVDLAMELEEARVSPDDGPKIPLGPRCGFGAAAVRAAWRLWLSSWTARLHSRPSLVARGRNCCTCFSAELTPEA